MPYSINYLAIFALTILGVDNAEEVSTAIGVVVVALIGLWARYRAKDKINIFGVKK